MIRALSKCFNRINYFRRLSIKSEKVMPDPLSLIQYTQREIKGLVKKLQGGQKKLQFRVGPNYDFEVLPDEIYYGTLKFDPLLENFVFLMKTPHDPFTLKHSKGEIFDLRVYISLSHKEPSEKMCDRAYHNVTAFILIVSYRLRNLPLISVIS